MTETKTSSPSAELGEIARKIRNGLDDWTDATDNVGLGEWLSEIAAELESLAAPETSIAARNIAAEMGDSLKLATRAHPPGHEYWVDKVREWKSWLEGYAAPETQQPGDESKLMRCVHCGVALAYQGSESDGYEVESCDCKDLERCDACERPETQQPPDDALAYSCDKCRDIDTAGMFREIADKMRSSLPPESVAEVVREMEPWLHFNPDSEPDIEGLLGQVAGWKDRLSRASVGPAEVCLVRWIKDRARHIEAWSTPAEAISRSNELRGKTDDMFALVTKVPVHGAQHAPRAEAPPKVYLVDTDDGYSVYAKPINAAKAAQAHDGPTVVLPMLVPDAQAKQGHPCDGCENCERTCLVDPNTFGPCERYQAHERIPGDPESPTGRESVCLVKHADTNAVSHVAASYADARWLVDPDERIEKWVVERMEGAQPKQETSECGARCPQCSGCVECGTCECIPGNLHDTMAGLREKLAELRKELDTRRDARKAIDCAEQERDELRRKLDRVTRERDAFRDEMAAHPRCSNDCEAGSNPHKCGYFALTKERRTVELQAKLDEKEKRVRELEKQLSETRRKFADYQDMAMKEHDELRRLRREKAKDDVVSICNVGDPAVGSCDNKAGRGGNQKSVAQPESTEQDDCPRCNKPQMPARHAQTGEVMACICEVEQDDRGELPGCPDCGGEFMYRPAHGGGIWYCGGCNTGQSKSRQEVLRHVAERTVCVKCERKASVGGAGLLVHVCKSNDDDVLFTPREWIDRNGNEVKDESRDDSSVVRPVGGRVLGSEEPQAVPAPDSVRGDRGESVGSALERAREALGHAMRHREAGAGHAVKKKIGPAVDQVLYSGGDVLRALDAVLEHLEGVNDRLYDLTKSNSQAWAVIGSMGERLDAVDKRRCRYDPSASCGADESEGEKTEHNDSGCESRCTRCGGNGWNFHNDGPCDYCGGSGADESEGE